MLHPVLFVEHLRAHDIKIGMQSRWRERCVTLHSELGCHGFNGNLGCDHGNANDHWGTQRPLGCGLGCLLELRSITVIDHQGCSECALLVMRTAQHQRPAAVMRLADRPSKRVLKEPRHSTNFAEKSLRTVLRKERPSSLSMSLSASACTCTTCVRRRVQRRCTACDGHGTAVLCSLKAILGL